MNNQNSGKNQIKDLLRNMRKENKKTIEQTADDMNVSRQTISNWESGKSTPDSVSFLKFLKSYDPTLESVKKMLDSLDGKNNSDEESILCERYCDLYKKTGSTFLNEIGGACIHIDDFLAFTFAKVRNEITPANNWDLFGLGLTLSLRTVNICRTNDVDIDFGFHMIELGLLLRRKGYIVNDVNREDGDISIIVLDENQRKQLDSIILKHMLIPESTLKELSTTERMALKDIQSEYDQVKQKIKEIKKEKLDPLNRDNRFEYGWPRCEYVLSIGNRMEDSNIETYNQDTIYTSESLEEMTDYITSLDKRIKKLVDNKNTFFVLTNNHEYECCFNPKGNSIDICDIKLYCVNCYDEDDEDNHGSGDDDE